MIMDRIYHPYYEWEDYLNGMYNLPDKKEENKLISLSIEVLTNTDLFLDICKEVLNNWKIASLVNMTNKQCNRKAWLGQASCSLKYNVPEICTRIAWGELSNSERFEADQVADKIINSFEVNYENKSTELHF